MKQLEGQIDLFEVGLTRDEEYHKCSECINAKFREYVNGDPFYWCNVARAYITKYSFNWLCRNKSEGFQRRIGK